MEKQAQGRAIMQIEDFKRWQWALIGLVAGLIFAYAWQDHDVTGDKTYELAEIKQMTFEREALSKSRETDPKSARAILQNVRVEPPVRDYMDNLRQIVTGKRLLFNPKDRKEYLVPFYYYASIPYQPRMLPPLGKNATVMDFLAAAQKTNPTLLHYRYAWELESRSFIALWAVSGVVVVGGIWPTVLNVLLGAGLGRPPRTAAEKEKDDYLSRFGKETKKPKPVIAAKGPTDADIQRLDDMNSALESQLAAAGVFATAAVSPAEQAASDDADEARIVALNAAPAEPAAHEKRHDETEEEFRERFAAGDFYPVARGSKKT